MRTLYLECKMGASGNMLCGALLDLLPNPQELVAQINALGIPGVEAKLEQVNHMGIGGNLFTVLVHGQEESHHFQHSHHHHRSLKEVEALITALPLPPKVKELAVSVFWRLGQAESDVHGVPMTDIHFHEVGSLDAVADIAGACLALEALKVDQVLVSPVHVGNGSVHCAHGILPVPAPATAKLLEHAPYYTGSIDTELCTPTGAALLTAFANDFGPQPPMTVHAIGYGFGTKELPQANCLRAFLGDTENPTDSVYELRCNLDDMTGEELGFLRQRLEEAGALDVTMIPVQMKKGRPGILLTCLCRQAQRETLCHMVLAHSTTAGVRYALWQRDTLEVSYRTRSTAYGPVREKQYAGFGIQKAKLEYEDLAAIARRENLSMSQIKQAIQDKP